VGADRLQLDDREFCDPRIAQVGTATSARMLEEVSPWPSERTQRDGLMN